MELPRVLPYVTQNCIMKLLKRKGESEQHSCGQSICCTCRRHCFQGGRTQCSANRYRSTRKVLHTERHFWHFTIPDANRLEKKKRYSPSQGIARTQPRLRTWQFSWFGGRGRGRGREEGYYKKRTYAVFTRATFTWGKCIFTIENVMQYNRNVNLPQVNVSRVNGNRLRPPDFVFFFV